MATTCFYKLCASRNKKFRDEWKLRTGLDNFSLWRAPNTTDRNAWTNNLPLEYRDFDFRNPRHVFCHLHFEEKFIVKNADYVVKDKTFSFPLLRWHLTRNAIPTVFEGTDYDSMMKFSNDLHSANIGKEKTEVVMKQPKVEPTVQWENQGVAVLVNSMNDCIIGTEIIQDVNTEIPVEGSSFLMQELGLNSLENPNVTIVTEKPEGVGRKTDNEDITKNRKFGASALLSSDEIKLTIWPSDSEGEEIDGKKVLEMQSGSVSSEQQVTGISDRDLASSDRQVIAIIEIKTKEPENEGNSIPKVVSGMRVDGNLRKRKQIFSSTKKIVKKVYQGQVEKEIEQGMGNDIEVINLSDEEEEDPAGGNNCISEESIILLRHNSNRKSGDEVISNGQKFISPKYVPVQAVAIRAKTTTVALKPQGIKETNPNSRNANIGIQFETRKPQNSTSTSPLKTISKPPFPKTPLASLHLESNTTTKATRLGNKKMEIMVGPMPEDSNKAAISEVVTTIDKTAQEELQFNSVEPKLELVELNGADEDDTIHDYEMGKSDIDNNKSSSPSLSDSPLRNDTCATMSIDNTPDVRKAGTSSSVENTEIINHTTGGSTPSKTVERKAMDPHQTEYITQIISEPKTSNALIKIAPKPFLVLPNNFAQIPIIPAMPVRNSNILSSQRSAVPIRIAPKPEVGIKVIPVPEITEVKKVPRTMTRGRRGKGNSQPQFQQLIAPKPDVGVVHLSESEIIVAKSVPNILKKGRIARGKSRPQLEHQVASKSSNQVMPRSKELPEIPDQSSISDSEIYSSDVKTLKRCSKTPIVLMTKSAKIQKLESEKNPVTANMMSHICMPSQDWCVNTYPSPRNDQLFSISETVLNPQQVEIIRKSITIHADWTMIFTVFSYEVQKFNIGVCASSSAEIQQVINKFATLKVCEGILPNRNYTNLPLVKAQITRCTDTRFRSIWCPMLIVTATKWIDESEIPRIRCENCEEILNCLELNGSQSLLLSHKHPMES